MQKKPLLIIPAYNEEKAIENLIENIKMNFPQYDYVIINDGSTDRTGSICKENHYNCVDLPINLGIGGAVQTGYRYAKKNGYQIAIQVDGDGQHDISFADSMVSALEKQETDIVIGSRFLEKEGFQSSAVRRFGIRFLSSLIFMCTRKKIYDVTSGFRAVNKKFIDIYADDYPDDYPEPEAIVAAVMYGGRIKELPVVMKERKNGVSSINLQKSIYYMIKVTLAILICRISFGIRRAKQ